MAVLIPVQIDNFASGMLWGGFAAFLIDGKIRNAVVVAFVAAVLTGFGIMHDSTLHRFADNSPLMWGYVVLGLLMLAKSRFPLEQEDELEPFFGDEEDELEVAPVAITANAELISPASV